MLNRPAIYLKILLLLLSFSMVRAQHEFDRMIDLSWADDGNAATYSAPFQGKRYIDPHRILNDKHKFFETFELQEGELIFDQDRYSGLQLKFDLFEQQLALSQEYNMPISKNKRENKCNRDRNIESD